MNPPSDNDDREEFYMRGGSTVNFPDIPITQDWPEHSCLDYLKFHSQECVEAHGLECGPYERWTEEWYQCSICGDKFTQKEADEIARGEREQEKA